mgnify:CR=1 FL=1
MLSMRSSWLIALCTTVLILNGCDTSNSSSSTAQVSLRSGTHYSIDNVNTGWTASGSYMKPFVEFDITNNGTEDVSVMTLVVQFWTPYPLADFQQAERMGSEQSRVITNFSSRDREHYRFVCSVGYSLHDGAWDRVTSQYMPAEVGIGIMYQNQTRVSSDNINQYTIDNDNID